MQQLHLIKIRNTKSNENLRSPLKTDVRNVVPRTELKLRKEKSLSNFKSYYLSKESSGKGTPKFQQDTEKEESLKTPKAEIVKPEVINKIKALISQIRKTRNTEDN